MAIWCLTKDAESKLLEALKNDGDPQKMVDRGSEGRLAFFTKIVGEENANNLNALFESKMLLKSQINGFKSFVKYMGGSKQVQRNFLSKVESLNKALSNSEVDQYLNDYIARRLDLEVTPEEFDRLTVLSQQVEKARVAGNIDEVSKLSPKEFVKWQKDKVKNEARKEYGRKIVAFDNYVTKLKQESAGSPTVGSVLKSSLDASKSTSASMDNSAILNQGFPILANYKTAGIWAKNALNSFKNIVNTFGGKEVMDEVKADVVSRPSYINGTYKEHKLAVNVLEEDFPSDLPSKADIKVKVGGKKRTIVPLGTAFKATEVAFNAFQLKNRVDVFDLFMAMAEKSGKDISRGSKDTVGLGKLVNSLTARGYLGKAEPAGNIINAPFFSLRRQVSIVESLLGYQTGKKSTFTRVQGAKAAIQQIIFIATVLGIAKALGADVEDDTTSADFGKIKIGDTRFDVTQGRVTWVVLASRILQQKYTSSTTGKVTLLNTGKFGSSDVSDIMGDFTQNKLSPALGQVVALINRRDRNTGKPPTVSSVIQGMYVPLSFRDIKEAVNNPNSANYFAIAIANTLGLNSNTYSKFEQQVPENVEIEEGSFIEAVTVYAKALDVDPVTAFNRIFTGQKIIRVTGNTVVVERMSLKKSQAIKEKWGGKTEELKLDHTIPLQLGGSNSKSNLKLVPTATHSYYTAVENHLGRALKSGKVTKKEAQYLIKEFKKGNIEKEKILNRFKDKK